MLKPALHVLTLSAALALGPAAYAQNSDVEQLPAAKAPPNGWREVANSDIEIRLADPENRWLYSHLEVAQASPAKPLPIALGWSITQLEGTSGCSEGLLRLTHVDGRSALAKVGVHLHAGVVDRFLSCQVGGARVSVYGVALLNRRFAVFNTSAEGWQAFDLERGVFLPGVLFTGEHRTAINRDDNAHLVLTGRSVASERNGLTVRDLLVGGQSLDAVDWSKEEWRELLNAARKASCAAGHIRACSQSAQF